MNVRAGCGVRRGSANAASEGSSKLRSRGGTSQAIAEGERLPLTASARSAGEIDQRLPVGGHESIEVHELADTIGDVRKCSGHHHAAVGEPDENDLRRVLIEHRVDNVFDVNRQVDMRTRQMSALTDPGEARGDYLMARLPKPRPYRPPRVGSAPRSVNQHKRRSALHPASL